MNRKQIFSVMLSVFVSVFFVCAVVYAASTIGNAVSVGSTLTVTGATTLNGAITMGNAAEDLISVPGTVNTALTWAATTTTYGLDMNAATMTTDLRLNNGALIANGDTSTLTITEATVAITGNETVSGTLTTTGATALNGVVTLGDATGSDTLSVPATVNTALIWAATSTTYGLDLDAATLTTDIRLDDGATIANASDVLTITEPTITVAGATKINLDGPTTVTGALFMDSTTAGNNLRIGTKASADGNGLQVTAAESENSTSEGLGIYTEIPSTATAVAGTETYRVLKSVWARLFVNKAQTADVTLLGAQSQVYINKNVAAGQHYGSWNVFQGGTVSLATGGENGGASISVIGGTITVDSGATLAGLMVDNSATVTNNGTFDAIHIKSNGTNWATGINIAGVTTDIQLQNSETISNATDEMVAVSGQLRPGVGADPGTCDANHDGALFFDTDLSNGSLVICDGGNSDWDLIGAVD